MNYCSKCLCPDTRPGIIIHNDKICSACKGHEIKENEIDWDARENKFYEIIKNNRTSNSNYDCIVPASGGKDSWCQIIKCKELGLTPLAVTWKIPGRTLLGQQNLDAMVKNLNVDHIDYSTSQSVEKRFMKLAFEKKGDPGLPFHMAVYSLPYRLAVQMNIPLIIWGENPQLEFGGNKDEQLATSIDNEWMKKHGCMQGTDITDWTENGLSLKDLAGYRLPNEEEFSNCKVKVQRLFLGSFFKWNSFDNAEIAKKYGFYYDKHSRKTGYWEFADLDCNFISLHHFPMWHKFGTNRVLDNLSVQIRYGLISKEEAISKAQEIGLPVPHEDIKLFCDFVGENEEWWWNTIEKFRNKNIWVKHENSWKINNFIVPSWKW